MAFSQLGQGQLQQAELAQGFFRPVRALQQPGGGVAQALAQANLDGGGNTDENRRAKTPLPPTQQALTGSDVQQMQRRVREPRITTFSTVEARVCKLRRYPCLAYLPSGQVLTTTIHPDSFPSQPRK